MDNTLKIGLVSISDRASSGVYEDAGLPALHEWFTQALTSPWQSVTRLIPDEQKLIESTLIELADQERCHLILTTGGTGPAPRDVTPEATRTVLEKELPGFGEIMRLHSYPKVKTAILSRATAGVRGRSLIINLPGRPTAIGECLPLLAPAIAEALDHLAGFRPALRDPVP